MTKKLTLMQSFAVDAEGLYGFARNNWRAVEEEGGVSN